MAAWAAIISLVLFFTLSNFVLAKPSIHVAVKGDSLKTISEAYYGNPDLWRELWQINPSIVNPNRVEPGFAVMLFSTNSEDDTPREVAKKDVELLSMVNNSTSLKNTRIDVSSYANVNTLGFLSPGGVTPCGSIISDETERIFLAEGDMGVVVFEKGVHIKPGDAFNVYQSSQPIRHPITGEAAGYNISFLGKIVVKNKVRDNVYQAEIMESYRTIRVGDPLIPFTPVSYCVQIQELDWDLLERNDSLIFSIVEAKDLQDILGKFSVIYLDRGYKQGIRRGNFFQVVDKGDAQRQEIPNLPYLIRGYVLILESQSDTSTGVVVYATRNFQPGSLLRAVDLKKAFFEILLTYKKEFREIVIEKGTRNLNLLEILARLDRDLEPKPDIPEGLRVLMHMPRCSIE